MAAFVPEVARAARMGDIKALSLFRQAGELHAKKLLLLIDKVDPLDDEKICVLCGGVWKAHPVMYDSFSTMVLKARSDIETKKPYFEPVMAGIIQKLTLIQPSWTEMERVAFLAEKFNNYYIYNSVK